MGNKCSAQTDDDTFCAIAPKVPEKKVLRGQEPVWAEPQQMCAPNVLDFRCNAPTVKTLKTRVKSLERKQLESESEIRTNKKQIFVLNKEKESLQMEKISLKAKYEEKLDLMRNKNLSKCSQNAQWERVLRNQRKQTEELVSNQDFFHGMIEEYKEELKKLRLKMNELEEENYELIQKIHNLELKNQKNMQQYLRLSRNLELKNEEISQLNRKYANNNNFENKNSLIAGRDERRISILKKEETKKSSFGGREDILMILDKQINFEQNLKVQKDSKTNNKSRVSRSESFGELLSDDLNEIPEQEEEVEKSTRRVKNGSQISLHGSTFSSQDLDFPINVKNLNMIIEAQHEQIENYSSEIENLKIQMESMGVDENKEPNETIIEQKKLIQNQKQNILKLKFSEEKLQTTIEEQREMITKLAEKIELYCDGGLNHHEDKNKGFNKNYSLLQQKHKKLQEKYYLLCKRDNLLCKRDNEEMEAITSSQINGGSEEVEISKKVQERIDLRVESPPNEQFLELMKINKLSSENALERSESPNEHFLELMKINKLSSENALERSESPNEHFLELMKINKLSSENVLEIIESSESPKEQFLKLMKINKLPSAASENEISESPNEQFLHLMKIKKLSSGGADYSPKVLKRLKNVQEIEESESPNSPNEQLLKLIKINKLSSENVQERIERSESLDEPGAGASSRVSLEVVELMKKYKLSSGKWNKQQLHLINSQKEIKPILLPNRLPKRNFHHDFENFDSELQIHVEPEIDNNNNNISETLNINYLELPLSEQVNEDSENIFDSTSSSHDDEQNENDDEQNESNNDPCDEQNENNNDPCDDEEEDCNEKNQIKRCISTSSGSNISEKVKTTLSW